MSADIDCLLKYLRETPLLTKKRKGVFISWCPGTTHVTAPMMAKTHNRSQMFYSDCFQ